jgi:hypothetical protein
MGWFSGYVYTSDPPVPVSGSGLELLRHKDDLGILSGSTAIVGGFDADGWYESFLGPGTTILLALGLAAVGVVIALRGARKPALLVGLWLALFSWLGAAGTASVDSQLSGEPGLRVWQLASVAAALVLGWAVLRSQPGQLGVVGAWIGLACVLALLPFAMWEYGIEDTNDFTAGPLFVANALEIGVPAAGAIIGLEVVRSEPRRPLRLIPAILTLVLSALLWGTSLLALRAA